MDSAQIQFHGRVRFWQLWTMKYDFDITLSNLTNTSRTRLTIMILRLASRKKPKNSSVNTQKANFIHVWKHAKLQVFLLSCNKQEIIRHIAYPSIIMVPNRALNWRVDENWQLKRSLNVWPQVSVQWTRQRVWIWEKLIWQANWFMFHDPYQ